MPDTYAFCADHSAALAVRDQFGKELGWKPTPNVMGDGSPLPPGVATHTLHAIDPEAILDKPPDEPGAKCIGYVVPMVKVVPTAAAGKVVEKTEKEIADLKDKQKPKPVAEPIEAEPKKAKG